MIAVWMKHELRIEDNPAFSAALTEGSVPLAICTDETKIGHVRLTNNRRRHEETLFDAIQARLAEAGGTAIKTQGDSASIIEALKSHGITKVHACIQIGDNISYRRDRDLQKALRECNIAYVEHNIDSVRRPRADTRFPSLTTAKSLAPVTYSRPPAALTALRQYLDRLPHANYRRDMWTPGPDATASSRLSIDIASGGLGSERVLHEVQLRLEALPRHQHQPYNQFAARIGWRNSFIALFEKNIDAFPWGPVRHPQPGDEQAMQAWLGGETGYPLVDAAMRDLTETGWINFRLRQVVSSFALDLLNIDLHRAGVALGELFDDYCPGIHWPQIGLQAGMSRGRGPRVINPTKQMRELDPTGQYCRRWLPWLREIDNAYIHEPWKGGKHRGPEAIVDYSTAAREARARHPM